MVGITLGLTVLAAAALNASVLALAICEPHEPPPTHTHTERAPGLCGVGGVGGSGVSQSTRIWRVVGAVGVWLPMSLCIQPSMCGAMGYGGDVGGGAGEGGEEYSFFCEWRLESVAAVGAGNILIAMCATSLFSFLARTWRGGGKGRGGGGGGVTRVYSLGLENVIAGLGCVLHLVSLLSSSLIEEEHLTFYFL